MTCLQLKLKLINAVLHFGFVKAKLKKNVYIEIPYITLIRAISTHNPKLDRPAVPVLLIGKLLFRVWLLLF